MTLQELFRIFRNQVTKSGPAPPIHFLQNFFLSLSPSHMHTRTNTHVLTCTRTHTRTRTHTLSLSPFYPLTAESNLSSFLSFKNSKKSRRVCFMPQKMAKGASKRKKRREDLFSFQCGWEVLNWNSTWRPEADPVPGSPLKRLIIFKRPGFQLNWITPGEA